jgi:hypothetical protein
MKLNQIVLGNKTMGYISLFDFISAAVYLERPSAAHMYRLVLISIEEYPTSENMHIIFSKNQNLHKHCPIEN